MEQLPFKKAYLYACNFTTRSTGENITITSVIALRDDSDSIENLMEGWRKQVRVNRTNHTYTLLKELDVQTACCMRGLRGGTIRGDYKLLDMPFCSVETGIEYHIEVQNENTL